VYYFKDLASTSNALIFEKGKPENVNLYQ